MSYSVGQASAFAGVTVRTLHHYDRAGLLSPSGRSGAGYRRQTGVELTPAERFEVFGEIGFDDVTRRRPHQGGLAAHRPLVHHLSARHAPAHPLVAVRRTGPSAGAATDPIPFASLTVERLADALGRAARQQAYARAASVAAQHMATEDGVGAVLKALG